MNDASVWQDEGLEALVAQVVDEFRAEQRAGAEPDIEEYAAHVTRTPPACCARCWHRGG